MKLSELIAGMQLDEAETRALFSKHLELALTVGPSSTHHCEILATLLTNHFWPWMEGYQTLVPAPEWPEGWGLVLEALARHPKIQYETCVHIRKLAHLKLTTQFYEAEIITQRTNFDISPDLIRAQFKPRRVANITKASTKASSVLSMMSVSITRAKANPSLVSRLGLCAN